MENREIGIYIEIHGRLVVNLFFPLIGLTSRLVLVAVPLNDRFRFFFCVADKNYGDKRLTKHI